MSTTIVVGSDGSAPSRAALAWAARRAGARGSGIVLCHVVDASGDAPGPVTPLITAGVVAGLEREADAARCAVPGVGIRCAVLSGRPVAVLADLAAGADVLVVGSHKTGFIHGRALGSRFAALVSLTDTAVAFIPDSPTSHRRGVVAGVGRSPADAVVLRRAAAEAEHAGEHLILVGSWEDTPSDVRLPDANRARTTAATVDAALDRAAAVAASDHPDLAVRVRNVHRGASDALIDASLAALLLVVGHDADPLGRAVTHDVLLNLSCPTIVVQEPAAATP